MVSRVNSLGLLGMDAFPVEVETSLSNGMPAFDMVGLPDTAVKESRERVRSAMKNCGFSFPAIRIVTNLAPAEIKKEGPIYDLPILVSLLQTTGGLSSPLDDCAFIGELSLSGIVRPVRGVLPMAIQAKNAGIQKLFVPAENAQEGAVVEGLQVYPVTSIVSLLDHFSGKAPISPAVPGGSVPANVDILPDFSQVRGQNDAKRALEIAAAGGHNVLMIGPPGSGKSMLAKRLPSILPDMTLSEQMETTKIHSIAGVLPHGSSLIQTRPFRSPHHTISSAGLSGGGMIPRPGELSLAHNGVLFLDELPEFSRASIEVLRQPIEDGQVTISRVNSTLTYPCSIMLVAAMNPCPCGYFGHPTHPCTCSFTKVSRYLARVSGPLLDRMDLHVEVPPVSFDHLDSQEEGEPSCQIKARVDAARSLQRERYQGTGISCNARITPAVLHSVCDMTESARKLLKNVFEKLGLSARAYDRILKVSRTIADLDRQEKIGSSHIAEAVQYRTLDRKNLNKQF